MASRICDLFGIEFLIFAFSHCRDAELLDATPTKA